MTDGPYSNVNAVLYGLIFAKELDDSEVDRIARAIIGEPYFDQTVDEVYVGLKASLDSDEPLTGMIPQPHPEHDIRKFIGQLLLRLEALRPWPDPPFRRLRIQRWPEFANGQTIARIDLSHITIGTRLGKRFSLIRGAPTLLGGLIMRLKSGEELALVAPWDIKIRDTRIVSRGDHPAPELLAAFRDATGFTEDEIIPLPT